MCTDLPGSQSGLHQQSPRWGQSIPSQTVKKVEVVMPGVWAAHSNGYDATHSLTFMLPDGRTYVALTGILLLADAQGGPDWVRGLIYDEIKYPDIPAGKGLALEHWTVCASPNSMARNAAGGKMGFAVDSFWLTDPTSPHDKAHLSVSIAVRESDASLLRLAYAITGVGRLQDWTPPPLG